MAVKKLLLIRHGKTQNNLERRYVDSVDEPLCAEGTQKAIARQKSGALPPVRTLISGKALRCSQTTELLFPGMPYAICDMAETDFGIFKGKSADELTDCAAYRQWVDTGCQGDIPGGDNVAEFKQRTCAEFLCIAENCEKNCEENCGEGTTALVIHGGNIMAILEAYAVPKRNFYDYHAPNCGFFLCSWENGVLTILQEGGTV